MVVGKTKLMRTRWYPRPHDDKVAWSQMLEGTEKWTIVPICNYDEGLGTPSAYEANPENAAFAEYGAPNCFPDSRVDFVIAELMVNMTKGALVTDNIDAISYAYMPIFMSFKEDYIAINELDSHEIQDILELQTESTDRQGFPLYNGTKVIEKFTNSALMHADVDGLTTTQVLEGVTFAQNDYYDMLHYKTNGPKLKSVQGGLKWRTITRNRPVHKVQFKLRRKTKFMNPFTFFGVMVGAQNSGTSEQFALATDTTDIPHLHYTFRYRYNEWNQDFNFKKV